jgi:hypothetical protein
MNTEFDLNAAIQRWRENLSQSPQFRAENLDELEAHLRDAIATMQGQRLTDEEVFLVATRRLGGVHALEPEFAKINAREVWLNRALWMLLGVQLWSLLGGISRIASELTALGLFGFGAHLAIGSSRNWAAEIGVLAGVVQMFALALGLWGCFWLIRRREQSLRSVLMGLLRQPRRLGLAVASVCVAFLLIQFFGYFERLFVTYTAQAQQLGVFMFARTLTLLALPVASTIAFVVITALVARRLFVKRPHLV